MQMNIAQPLWYHPTMSLLIDDDEKVLKSIEGKIDPDFPSLAYKNPEAALEYLKQHVLPLEKLSQAIISEVEPSEEKHLAAESVAINFAPLHDRLDKPERFTRFVTVIVDKVMKEMDGLDFCRKVKKLGLPVKLILLTGNAGADEALAAFNDRIIDAFIKKSPNMMEEVNQQIKSLALAAFCDNSIQLMGPILNRFPLLREKAFADFCQRIFQENEIVEYYVLDSSCSYLLLTATGKVKILLIKSAADFKNAHDIVSFEQSADTEVLEALEKCKAFPFTEIGSYFTADSTQWKNHMLPMKKNKDFDFYYTVTDFRKDVLSFKHFIDEIWEPKII